MDRSHLPDEQDVSNLEHQKQGCGVRQKGWRATVNRNLPFTRDAQRP